MSLDLIVQSIFLTGTALVFGGVLGGLRHGAVHADRRVVTQMRSCRAVLNGGAR